MSITVEKLNEDLKVLNERKEQTLQSFNQILGAISIMEQLIYRLNNPDWEKKTEDNIPTTDVLPVDNAEKVLEPA